MMIDKGHATVTCSERCTFTSQQIGLGLRNVEPEVKQCMT